MLCPCVVPSLMTCEIRCARCWHVRGQCDRVLDSHLCVSMLFACVCSKIMSGLYGSIQ